MPASQALHLREDQQVSEIMFDTSAASPPSSELIQDKSSDKSSDYLLGVRQIWVHKSCRRLGISNKLIDISRRYFVFGTVISRENVAFSQPTDDGRALAFSYTNLRSELGKYCLIYPG